MNSIMNCCIEMALKNIKKDEIPVSAVIIKDGKIISRAKNNKNIKKDVLGHAEILCIRKASKKLKRWNLSDCTMVVTLEPCDMCKLAIKESRITKVVYLVERSIQKKIYNKTIFEQILNMDEQKKIYKEKMSEFFLNKR